MELKMALCSIGMTLAAMHPAFGGQMEQTRSESNIVYTNTEDCQDRRPPAPVPDYNNNVVIDLVRVLRTDIAWQTRADAAQTLGKLGIMARSAASDLIIVSMSDVPEVRAAVTVALFRIGVDQKEVNEALPAMISTLHGSPLWELRRFAAQTLGELGIMARSAVSDLIIASVSDVPEVRAAAAEALILIQGSPVPHP